MNRAFDPLPRREMFFPKTRRGHGSTHATPRETFHTKTTRHEASRPRWTKATLCVDATCTLNQPKSKNAHTDTEANLKEWCEDHQLSLKYTSACTAMLRATGAR